METRQVREKLSNEARENTVDGDTRGDKTRKGGRMGVGESRENSEGRGGGKERKKGVV